jgi:hypothetical protein
MGRRYRGRDLRGSPRKASIRRPVTLSQIRRPTLVLCGAKDLATRQQEAADLALRIPRSRLLRLPGSGHLPNLDVPLRYEQALRGFLRRYALRSRKS